MATGRRAEDQTFLGISLPKNLKDRIKAASEKEKRTMANWCVFHLEQMFKEMDENQKQEPQSKPTALPSPISTAARKQNGA